MAYREISEAADELASYKSLNFGKAPLKGDNAEIENLKKLIFSQIDSLYKNLAF